VSTSDVPIVTRRHTRVGILVSARCAVRRHRSSRMVMRSLTYESEDFCFALPVREKTGICPRTPFIVSRTCKPKPAGRAAGNLFREPFTRASFRLLSIRAPRQAVLRTSSWLAPSDHHPALQPEGREDTRYDQPMSATHTNYVHPHLARSQLALATFAAGTPHGVLGSVT